MSTEPSPSLIGWLIEQEFCVYLRPHKHNSEGELMWRVTAERMSRRLVYVVEEDVELEEAIRKVYRQVRKQLGIKTRKRARRAK